jgi:hypothetical protein
MSDWDDKLPWRGDEQREADIRAEVEAQALQENVIDQMVMLNMAIYMRMGEEVIEDWVDRVWNGLREGILEPGVPSSDPRRQKLDLILGAYLATFTDHVSYGVSQLIHDMECPVHGVGVNLKESSDDE